MSACNSIANSRASPHVPWEDVVDLHLSPLMYHSDSFQPLKVCSLKVVKVASVTVVHDANIIGGPATLKVTESAADNVLKSGQC